jgi:hypothetical protein
VSSLSDEQLLKRAGHAGRNLGALAALGTLLTVVLVVAAMVARDAWPQVLCLPAGACAIAAGYWVLMVAAKRGEPVSVTVALILTALHLAVGGVMVGLIASRNPELAGRNAAHLVVPIVVLLVLAASRKDLVEIRKRGLSEKAFPGAAPAGRLCVIGGVLLAFGVVGLNVGAVAFGVAQGQRQVARLQEARVFIHIVEKEEKAFLQALKTFFDEENETALPAAYQEMNARLAALETRVETARKGVTDNQPLVRVLSSYAAAVAQWRKGVDALALAGADPAAVQKHFQNGDRIRAGAAKEFDRRFCTPQPD